MSGESERRQFFADHLLKSGELDARIAELSNDRSLFINEHPSNLKYASDELLNDRTFLLEVLSKNEYAFPHCGKYKEDRDFILEAAKLNSQVLNQIPKNKFRSDRDIMLGRVKLNGKDLNHASKELQANKEIVLGAVKQDGSSLRYASKELQADKEVVLEAVKQDGASLLFASKELQADKEVVLEAVKQDSWALISASKELQELCKDRDPVQAIEGAIRMQKMQEQLKPKAPSQTRSLKI